MWYNIGMKNFSLPKIKMPKDKQFELLSRVSQKEKGKLSSNPFNRVKKDSKEIASPKQARSASKRPVKKYVSKNN